MPDRRDDRRPLTEAQYGIWMGQQLDPQSPAYNTGECVEIHGAVDVALFESALRRTVGEAESLHARFVTDHGEPQQVLDPPPDWTMPVIEVGGELDPWKAAEAWMQDDLGTPVDLERGPLFSEALLELAPDRFLWYQRVHHIAMDGYGFSLVARRVAEVYTALASGRSPADNAFGPLDNVIREDAGYRSSEQFERDRAFWTERFPDRPDPASLAGPPSPMSRDFLRRIGHLKPSVVEKLYAAARRAKGSWADIVVAATAAYLHRETGAPEVILGLPVMGRLGSSSLRVPCMAMNIVPLRVPVGPDDALAELSRRVSARVRELRPHQRYRHEQLRRDLRLIGGDRRLFGPVVNIMPFDYDLSFAGHRATVHNVSAGPVEDLSIGVYARSGSGGLRVDFDANPQSYAPDDLAAHQERFLGFLEYATEDPDRKIGAAGATAPVAAAGLRRRSVPAPNAGEEPSVFLDGGPLPAPPRPVVELISDRAKERPEAIALEHGCRRVSYGELVADARRLAARLTALGAGPDTPVAVLLPRGVEAVTAILGVLFSGAGYLPLDPDGPESRISAVLDDAEPPLLLTTSRHAGRVRGDGSLRVLLLDKRAEDFATEEPPAAGGQPGGDAASEEDLAYVIYTSGSTGRPNGVMVRRGALASFVVGATRRYGIGRDDRVLQFAPLHFDASVEEIFLTLCAGATLVVRTDEMLQSVTRLLDACEEYGISVLDLPTALWHEVAYGVSNGAASLPACVRTVIIGGEAALPERVARWRRAVGDSVELLNTYGPTEATVVATAATLCGTDPADDADGEVPIGSPLAGVRAAVLDDRGRPVSPGEVGELYLAGGGLARGYLRRPDLDAERFVVLDWLPGHPRAYRTGDLVRQRGDGQLVFVGRADDEFKISGHRVNPAEIEATLLAHPKVRGAAVVGEVLRDGTRRLSAHIVAGRPVPTTEELRRHLRSALPAAVIPSAFRFADRLPTTGSGKIDRDTLRDTGSARSPLDPASRNTFPATDLERTVLGVWEQVLGADSLSARDDFFDLGGQSLQAIQASNRLGVELGREVPVALVFRHPTAAALARALEDSPEHGTSTGTGPERNGLPEAVLVDAVLPESVVPPSLPPVSAGRTGPASRVLLTGVTGFVGAHLLSELLAQTEARVVCPVRAGDPERAMDRIRRSMAGWGLSVAGVEDRVVAVPADLTQPRLGLGEESFRELAEGCDAIYHNAAVVSVLRGYGSLRAANVVATREFLRLAAAGDPSPLHYVSTVAVAPPATVSAELPEDFLPPHPGLRDGYQQSKWVSERLVEQAGERGLPVSVYRLGRVVGAPDTGLVNEQDLLWRLLLTGIPAGTLPQLDVSEAWTPVDFVARAIVRLSLAARTSPAVFNLTPAPEVRLADLIGWVQDYGYHVDPLPVPEWRARIEEGSEAPDEATLAFFDLQPGGEDDAGIGRVRSEETVRSLAGSGIECPHVDRHLLHRYLDHCVEAGLLPAVSRR